MTVGSTRQRGSQPAPLSSARRWVLAVGVLLSVAAIAWGVLLLVNLLGRTTEDRSATLPATGGQLILSSSGGGIRVAVGDVTDIRVVSHLVYGLSAPRLRQDAGPGGVRLAASCPWYSSLCSVTYEITLPTGMAVRAESSGGSISVRGVTGAVDTSSSGGPITVSETTSSIRAHSSGGSVTVTASTGAVDLDSSGGGIVGTGLRGDRARAESSGGSVRLVFDAPPRLVEASSSGGGVEVRLPRVDGGYRVDATSSGGGQVVDVPTDPASTRRVTVHSSGGDARVLSSDAG
ncbi:MAG: hypothetical protein ACJ73E_05190 [Mycobacteriales bacterium]